jgi:ammonium transporter, Amt family
VWSIRKQHIIDSSALNSASLVSGAAAWKDRPGHFLVFILFWATFVYDPIARWTWSPDGWANKWGVLDFAGGTAVHINAGATTLAHCVFHLSVLPLVESLLSRLFGVNDAPHTNGVNGAMIPLNPPQNPPAHQPPPEDTEFYNPANVVLGTLLLWIGWFGFNGGSALGANLRAVSACVSTHLAACSGGVTLCLLRSISEHYFPETKPNPVPTQGNLLNTPAPARPASTPIPQQGPPPFAFSIAEFCNGAIIGLVCITPAAGYVPHQIAPLFGVLSTLVCSQLTPLSDLLRDTQNIVVVHGIAGLIGMLMTGIFARGQVAALDGVSRGELARGGWDGHWRQLL